MKADLCSEKINEAEESCTPPIIQEEWKRSIIIGGLTLLTRPKHAVIHTFHISASGAVSEANCATENAVTIFLLSNFYFLTVLYTPLKFILNEGEKRPQSLRFFSSELD